MTNEELIQAFASEIIGTIFRDEGFSDEKVLQLKKQILERMECSE